MTAALIATVLLSACGGGGSDKVEPPKTSDAARTTPPSTSASPQPAYTILNEKALEASLLGVDKMPVGYSQDAQTTSATDKTFCDYKEPSTAKLKVSRDFTKGAGVSVEIASVGVRQYEGTHEAAAAFKALTDALETCKNETFDGQRLTYSVASAPKVGDGSIGVRIETDGFTLLQNFALAGPSLINAGSGGVSNANADEAATLLEDQVMSYLAATRR